MKVNAVLVRSPKRSRRIRAMRLSRNRTDGLVLVVFFCLFFGLLCGVLLFVNEKDLFTTGLSERYLLFTSALSGRGFLELWSGFLVQNALFWGLLLFCGTSAFGPAVILPALSLKGAGLGAVAAFFLRVGGTQGVGYYFLCLFPGKILLLFGLLPAAHHAMRLSSRIRGRLHTETGNDSTVLKRYLMLFLFSFLFFFLSSILDALLLKTAGPLFNLPFSAAD